MKIALVSAYFYPLSQGGTEKYVLNLAKKLIQDGDDVNVITVDSTIFKTYEYQNIKVYAISDEIYTEKYMTAGFQPGNMLAFQEILRNEKYDIVHFHTLTPAFNIHHIELAKKNGAKIHFTAHVSSITCIHGDLMQFGQVACDGIITQTRCTACHLSKSKLPKKSSLLLANTILFFGFPKNLSVVVTRKQFELKRLNEISDVIFLFTKWQKLVFVENGFDPEKIIITNQIINRKLIPNGNANKNIQNIGFVGRITREKGLHILIHAFNKIAKPKIQLHIAGIINDLDYHKSLIANVKNRKIIWSYNLDEQQMEDFYKKIDLLVIPSISYETGPFVLFEALERNIPIIANDLGDISEWKKRGFNVNLYTKESELILLLSNL